MTDQAGALAWDRVAKPFGGTVSIAGSAANLARYPRRTACKWPAKAGVAMRVLQRAKRPVA